MFVPFAEEKISGCRDTCITSSNRVTDQKPGPGGEPRDLGLRAEDDRDASSRSQA